MSKNKVYIVVNNLTTQLSGGFSFLNYLSYKLKKKKLLSNNLKNANIILINSHHNFLKIIFLKFLNFNKIFVQRIDGPISKYTSINDYRDKLAYLINNYVVDATIYQSNWSKKKLKFKSNINTIIRNSADDRFFFKRKNIKKINNSIIISSWSANVNKGFLFYKFLDENLNFKKYKVNFVGNSNFKFKNIKVFKKMNKKKLSNFLCRHKVYITGSKNDPCSNSLIEAISCGLVPLAFNSGGHPEIINQRNLIFRNKKNLLEKIKFIFNKKNYLNYKKNLKKTDAIDEYIDFFNHLSFLYKNEEIQLKKVNLIILIYMFKIYFFLKLKEKIKFFLK